MWLPISPILPFSLCPSPWLPSRPMPSNFTLPSNPHTTPSWHTDKKALRLMRPASGEGSLRSSIITSTCALVSHHPPNPKPP